MKALVMISCLILSFSCLAFAQDTNNARIYKVGDTGPGGGLVFFVDGPKYLRSLPIM
jgi:hypothetical protein